MRSSSVQEIKVGYCVAYDWEMLRHSLPLIYPFADKICLSVDDKTTSWSGNPFSFDEAGFAELISKLDTRKKIQILRDDYHLRHLTPMQNEVRQRNEIARHLGAGGWHIQLDCDEYFLEFGEFVKYLQHLPEEETKRVNVSCAWITLFKQTTSGFLYVDPGTAEKIELMQIATRAPKYEYGRRNGNFNIVTNFKILHQSWARSDAEIVEKVNNWGHSQDIDKEGYIRFWQSLDEGNFTTAVNFHHMQPVAWPRLKFVNASNIDALIHHFDLDSFPRFTRWDLIRKNSLWISRVHKFFRLLTLRA